MWSKNESNQSTRWTNKNINKLICLYKKHKCLWKKDDSFYLDRKKRNDAYENICKNLLMTKVTFIQVIIKIQEVRRLYVNELKKIFHAERDGYHYEPNFQWFWRLHQFLHPYLDHEEILKLDVC